MFLRPLAYLCGTRALLQRLTAMAIRRSKRRTSALRSARERESEKKKRQRAGTRGAEVAGPVLRSHGVGQTYLGGQAHLCSRGRGQEPTFVAKPSYVHIEVAKPAKPTGDSHQGDQTYLVLPKEGTAARTQLTTYEGR